MGSLKWVKTVLPPLYKGMAPVLDERKKIIDCRQLFYFITGALAFPLSSVRTAEQSTVRLRMWPSLFSWALCLTLITTILASPIQKRAQGPRLALDTNFPDPSFVQHDDGKWYAFGTNGNGKRVQVATSPDFKTWTLLDKEVLPTLAGWETEVDHWAPDVIRRVCDSSPHGLTFNLLFINYYYVLGTRGVVRTIYY